jgi:hypothetical protein
MILQTLPVLVGLSWLPVATVGTVPAMSSCCPSQQKPQQQTQTQPAQQALVPGMITCVLTGEQIPACCCPVKE